MRYYMDKKVLVIGDLILDVYIKGHYVKKNSENAPVFMEDGFAYMAGGAGNVASNMVQAGLPTTLIGVLGVDQASQCFHQTIEENGVDISALIVNKDWEISVKKRYMVHEKQVFRCDRETAKTNIHYVESSIMDYLHTHINEFSLIVLVDYAKGVVSPGLASQVIQLANQYGKRIITDSKSSDLASFKGSYLIKMNHQELSRIIGTPCNSLDIIKRSAEQIKTQCQCNYVLITWGEKGMVLLSDDSSILHVGNHLNKPVSPALCTVGAGDTVTAFLAAGIENHFTITESLFLASQAAEAVVNLPMTAVLHDMPFEKQLELIRKSGIRYKNYFRSGGTEHEQNIPWNQHWA